MWCWSGSTVRAAPHRCFCEDRRGRQARREMPAAYQRPAPVGRGHRTGRPATAGGRTRLAGHETGGCSGAAHHPGQQSSADSARSRCTRACLAKRSPATPRAARPGTRSACKRSIALGLRNLPAGLEDSIRSRSPMAWFSVRVAAQVEQDNPIVRARTYCPASAASAISASATMIAKPRARKILPAAATTLGVPTTGEIPIMSA